MILNVTARRNEGFSHANLRLSSVNRHSLRSVSWQTSPWESDVSVAKNPRLKASSGNQTTRTLSARDPASPQTLVFLRR